MSFYSRLSLGGSGTSEWAVFSFDTDIDAVTVTDDTDENTRTG